MHELSLAQSLVELLEQQRLQYRESAKNTSNDEVQVLSAQVKVGALSCVSIEALEFAMQSLLSNSLFSDLQVIFELESGLLCCNECGHQFDAEQLYVPCPQCEHIGHRVLAGRDVYLQSIEIGCNEHV